MAWFRKSDVIVVTGGANGLGAQLVRKFAVQGYSVAALDLRLPDEDDRFDNALYLECDITSYDQLNACKEQIEQVFGTPTVLINNAGIRLKKGAVVDTQVQDFELTLDVNLSGTFRSIKVFVPGMVTRQRGYIVNIASALGYVSPAGLSGYGASKAGIIALHESLKYEMQTSPCIKMLLVCPGQIDTNMFADVKTPSRLLAPILSQLVLAKRIANSIERGKIGKLYAPQYVYFLPIMRALPDSITKRLRQVSGVDQAALN